MAIGADLVSDRTPAAVVVVVKGERDMKRRSFFSTVLAAIGALFFMRSTSQAETLDGVPWGEGHRRIARAVFDDAYEAGRRAGAGQVA